MFKIIIGISKVTTEKTTKICTEKGNYMKIKNALKTLNRKERGNG